MKYRHNWKLTSETGMYDDWYRCSVCDVENMQSIDNAETTNPEFGCTPPKEQNQKRLILEVPEEGYIDLPNGCTLYWQRNEVGGRTYTSDEVGPQMIVWDTALTDDSTLLAAMTHEAHLVRLERYWAEKKK